MSLPTAPRSLAGALGVVLAGVLLVSGATTATSAAPPPTPSTTQVVVVLEDATPVADVLRAVGLRDVARTFSHAATGFSARVTDAQARALRADPRVAWMGEDRVVARRSAEGLEPATGQLLDTGIRRIGVPESPTAAVDGVDAGGVDADIAIVDGGVDPAHPDLRVVGGVNCVDDTSPYLDVDGHGTFAAGMAAAIDNDEGVVGAAPGARIWAVKSFDDSGYMTLEDFMCALDWIAANAATLEVASMSFIIDGTVDGHCGRVMRSYLFGLVKRQVLVDPYHQAVCRIVRRGTAVVASAGNFADDTATYLPAAYPQTIAVSALADHDGLPGGIAADDACFEGEIDDGLASFSNFGADVDIAAPGICLTSTAPGDSYAFGDGTSFSAPLVSGAAALVASREPRADAARIRAVVLGRAEQWAMPGDPDGIAEPILDLRGY